MSSKFQMRCTPQVEASGGQEQYYIRSSWHCEGCNWECSGQSDVPPGRGIWWSRAVLCKVSLTFQSWIRLAWLFEDADVPFTRGIWWSRGVIHKVSLIFIVIHQISWHFVDADIPPIEASSGQECQFHISTVRPHIGRSTGRSNTPWDRPLVVKNGSFTFLLLGLILADQVAEEVADLSRMVIWHFYC